jgi:putative oxidoreductase
MAAAFLVGRLLVGAYYLFSAYQHFSHVRDLAQLAAHRGMPLATPAVLIAGVLLVLAGVTLLLGVWPRIGVVALVLFFVPVTLVMHSFWWDVDAGIRMANLIHFTKNMALLGSSLMFLAVPEPWPYSVGQRVRWRARLPA